MASRAGMDKLTPHSMWRQNRYQLEVGISTFSLVHRSEKYTRVSYYLCFNLELYITNQHRPRPLPPCTNKRSRKQMLNTLLMSPGNQNCCFFFYWRWTHSTGQKNIEMMENMNGDSAGWREGVKCGTLSKLTNVYFYCYGPERCTNTLGLI